MTLALTRSAAKGDREICFVVSGGPVIVVRVAEIKGNRVTLACVAPASVAIHRREVLDEIERERRAQGLPPLVALGPDSTDRVAPFTKGHTPASAGPDRA